MKDRRIVSSGELSIQLTTTTLVDPRFTAKQSVKQQFSLADHSLRRSPRHFHIQSCVSSGRHRQYSPGSGLLKTMSPKRRLSMDRSSSLIEQPWTRVLQSKRLRGWSGFWATELE